MNTLAVVIKSRTHKFIRIERTKSGKKKYIYFNKKGRISDKVLNHSLPALKAMFKRREPGKGGPKKISSVKDLKLILENTTYCFLSAGVNPNIPEDRALSKEAVAKRHLRLKQELIKRGFIYTPAIGKYQGLPENSIIVMTHDANKREMIEIGNMFNQDSVLFSNKGNNELIYTTGKHKGEVDARGSGYEFIPKAKDFYTQIDIHGKPFKFSMKLWNIAKAIIHLIKRHLLMKARF